MAETTIKEASTTREVAEIEHIEDAMAQYRGQHFAQTASQDVVVSKRMAVLGAALGLVLLAGSFALGRTTAPDGGATAVATASAGGSSATDAKLQQALSLHANGKLSEAAPLYNDVLKSDAKNKYALYNLGLIAQTNKDFDEAITKYKAALAVDANYAPAVYNLGLAYAADGDNTNAIAMLRKAQTLQPNNAGVLMNLGKLLVATGQNDEGAKLIAQAITIDPSLRPTA